jgi:sec-independent protein translocase protein TatA
MMTPLASLGNLFGGPDMIVILLVVLLLFGAKKLPELARGLGQSLNEFRKAREDFEHELRAGQQDVQAREAGNRQTFAGAPVPPPAAALPYSNVAAAAPAESPEALRLKVEQLEQKLRALEAQKEQPAQNTPV